uniref:DUF4406 domain-containing protein n=1 Tax=viral metagenome TaxID=1070528 RepID=A0A6M3LQ89_9ZZZZ
MKYITSLIKMKLIYVAGKYNSTSEVGLERNIRHAEEAAKRLWLEGWAVICPHKNTAHFGGLLEDPQKDRELWMAGDKEMVRRCDAIYMLNNWQASGGATEELELAKELGLEIYFE